MANTKSSPAREAEACAEGLNLPSQTREEYVDSVLQQVADFEERLNELESDMESSGWDDISDFRGQLDDLRLRLKALRSRSEELEAVADSSWRDVRDELEDSLADVAGSVEDLSSALSQVLPE